jgi:hypothetical protein
MANLISPPGYLEIISTLYPGLSFGMSGPLYTDIDWGGGTPIPQATLDAQQVPCYIIEVNQAITAYIGTWIDQGYTYLGSLYNANPPTYQNMQGTMLVITSGGDLLPSFVWWDAANVGHPMDNGAFSIFYNSFTSWYNAMYLIGYKKKTIVSSFTSMSECATYDIAVGWPASDTDMVAWYAAENVVVQNPRRVISTLSFRQRFTATERGTITAAAASALSAGDPTLQVYLDDLGASVVVNLDDPETVGAITLLTADGLLDPSRTAVLLADGLDSELPNS